MVIQTCYSGFDSSRAASCCFYRQFDAARTSMVAVELWNWREKLIARYLNGFSAPYSQNLSSHRARKLAANNM